MLYVVVWFQVKTNTNSDTKSCDGPTMQDLMCLIKEESKLNNECNVQELDH